MTVKKIQPPFLRKGDEVAIISPSFAIDETKIGESVRILEGWGLKVRLGRNIFSSKGPFAGTDEERLYDFQEVTADRNIKAVICSRGGYGMMKIIDKINFSSLNKYPKWYVGFSDITALHLWLEKKCNLVSIHGEMPLNYTNPGKSASNLDSLRDALFGDWKPVEWSGNFLMPGDVSGEITGGNLSLIHSLIGTPAEPETRGRILFIEEVGEYLYHLDRMMTSLRLADKLKGLSAIITGGFSKMEETKDPWGKTPEEIISDAAAGYKYPVFFNFPAGHVSDNRAFYLGKRAKIRIMGGNAILSYP